MKRFAKVLVLRMLVVGLFLDGTALVRSAHDLCAEREGYREVARYDTCKEFR